MHNRYLEKVKGLEDTREFYYLESRGGVYSIIDFSLGQDSPRMRFQEDLPDENKLRDLTSFDRQKLPMFYKFKLLPEENIPILIKFFEDGIYVNHILANSNYSVGTPTAEIVSYTYNNALENKLEFNPEGLPFSQDGEKYPLMKFYNYLLSKDKHLGISSAHGWPAILAVAPEVGSLGSRLLDFANRFR